MRRRLLDAHPGDGAGDHQLLDLARALEDRVDPGLRQLGLWSSGNLANDPPRRHLKTDL